VILDATYGVLKLSSLFSRLCRRCLAVREELLRWVASRIRPVKPCVDKVKMSPMGVRDAEHLDEWLVSRYAGVVDRVAHVDEGVHITHFKVALENDGRSKGSVTRLVR
jgi:hypothetical protein